MTNMGFKFGKEYGVYNHVTENVIITIEKLYLMRPNDVMVFIKNKNGGSDWFIINGDFNEIISYYKKHLLPELEKNLDEYVQFFDFIYKTLKVLYGHV